MIIKYINIGTHKNKIKKSKNSKIQKVVLAFHTYSLINVNEPNSIIN